MTFASSLPTRTGVILVTLFAFAACGPDQTPVDAGGETPDAAEVTPDAGETPDAAGEIDAGEEVDAGDVPDAGEEIDAGEEADAGPIIGKENLDDRCSDGFDNDSDGFTDCGDFKCLLGVEVSVCGVTAESYVVSVADLMTEPPVANRPTPSNLDGLNTANAATKIVNRVTLTGPVTVISPILPIGSRNTPSFFVAAPGAAASAFGGLYVFAGESGLDVDGAPITAGSKLYINGVFQTREAAGGGLQLRAQELIGAGSGALPTPAGLSFAELTTEADQRRFQSVLVNHNSTLVVRSVNTGAGTFEVSTVADAAKRLTVSLEFIPTAERAALLPAVRDTYTNATGILHRLSNASRLMVRSAADLTKGTPLAPDTDNDGTADDTDNCPDVANTDQADSDNDTVGNVCDNCPNVSNGNQLDSDNNGTGDACQAAGDADGDTIADATDNCPNVANQGQANGDSDTLGDACDNCPLVANQDQANANGDAYGDACQPAVEPARAPGAGDLLINEILVDPATSPNGDANFDGTTNSADDEFVELYNASNAPLLMEGVQLHSSGGSGASRKFTFPAYTLPIGKVVVVFGGGTTLGSAWPAGTAAFGGAQTYAVKRDGAAADNKSSGISFTNSGSQTFSARASDGTTVLAQVTWGTASANIADAAIDASLTRNPDVTGTSFVSHLTASPSAAKFSPGTKVDGTAF